MNEENYELEWKNIKPTPDFEFCSFLMANEYDKSVDNLIEKYIPPGLFKHPFIKKFLKMWRREVASGQEDTHFQKELEEYEREWFDEILLGTTKYNSTSLSAEQIAKNFIAYIWYTEFCIVRFIQKNLNDNGDRDISIINLTILLKRLKSGDWKSFEKDLLERIKLYRHDELD